MDNQDRRAIEELFAKLQRVERQAPPRDPDAEAFIRAQINAQPGAPYYMAQTIIVQERALEAAQRRLAELEGGTAEGGGLLSGIFGGRQRSDGHAARRQPAPARPWQGQPQAPGGFLAGAAQTAMGVAGGVLLGNLLAGAFFGGSEAQAADNDPSPADASDADSASDFDDGGGFGDGGDFGGGDF